MMLGFKHVVSTTYSEYLGRVVRYLDDRGRPVGGPGTVTRYVLGDERITITWEDGSTRDYRRPGYDSPLCWEADLLRPRPLLDKVRRDEENI